jgi:hypothetical protein
MHLTAAAGLAVALAAIPAASFGQDNPEVQVRGRSKSYTYFMDRKEVALVRGVYAMSDGTYLDVQNHQRKLMVWLDGRQNELHAIAHNEFASRDRNVTLKYTDEGHYGQIAVSYIPQSTLAGGGAKMVFLTSK